MDAEQEKQAVQALLSIAESLDWLRRLAFNACNAYNAKQEASQQITPPPLDFQYPLPRPQPGPQR